MPEPKVHESLLHIEKHHMTNLNTAYENKRHNSSSKILIRSEDTM